MSYLLIFTLLLLACSSKKNTYIGVFKHTIDIGSEYIEIYKDSTFLYTSTIPFRSSTSKGKWFLTGNGNQLVLKSFDFYKSNYFEVQELESNESKSTVQFIDNNINLPYMILLLNENQKFVSDVNGKIENIVIKKNDKIRVVYITELLDNEYTILNDYESFNITVKVNPKNHQFIYLNDKTNVRKNKILIDNKIFLRVEDDRP